MDHDNTRPVFLFSAGWRSGSTMLQRLIISSGQVLMWGEAGGGLNSARELAQRYARMVAPGDAEFPEGRGGSGGESLTNFRARGKDGVHEWIACMNMPEDVVESGLRCLFRTIYADPAREMGYPRWGVKEVVSGVETARFLRRLYPDAKFVFLVRNPMACLLSLKRRNWLAGAVKDRPVEYFARIWRDLATGFKDADFGFYLRYEDLIRDERTVKDLQEYLEIDGLSAGFIKSSRADWETSDKRVLTARERFAAGRLLRDEMRRHGYPFSWLK
jgi:hypothetical protein